ncbi:hypothetical protein RYX36_001357 [Vicia faba]
MIAQTQMVSKPDSVGHVGIRRRPTQGGIEGMEVVFESHIIKFSGLYIVYMCLGIGTGVLLVSLCEIQAHLSVLKKRFTFWRIFFGGMGGQSYFKPKACHKHW